MHVYITCPHSRAGGGTKVLLNLAQGLCQNGFTVTVIFRKFTDIAWYGEAPLFQIKVIPYITYQDMPDCSVIIHYGDDSVYGPYPNVPRILYLQGFGTQEYAREVPTLFFPYTKVVAVSDWVADIAKQAGHKDVRVIPPAVDPYFKNTPREKIAHDHIFGAVYHAAATKNITMLLEALAWGEKNIKGTVCCFFVSSLPPSKAHAEFLDTLNIRYKFFVSPIRTQLPSVYCAVDAWACTSVAEGFGLPPLEAMACGVPVVTVSTLGLHNVLIDRVNCLLVNNAKDMASALWMINDNKNLRKTIIAGGYALAAQYSMDRFVQSFVSLLGELKCIQ